MTSTAPLTGIRILDLSRVLAGPWATQLLADLGAEIVKIERPGEGDDTRGWGPPYQQSPDHQAREAAYFLSANRGKRSVAIDIAQPEGAGLVAALADHCDVLVENFKVGGLRKYGLDYEALRARNPRLVYCSITGFGQDGPYAARPGYDFIVQGMTGLMSVTGEAAGDPMKVGVAIADILTGLYAANAIQAALRQRDATGVGQHIDIALLDVQLATMANQALNFLVSGKSPGRMGNAHPNIVPYQAFDAADGAFTVAVGNDGQFARFCRVLDLPELPQSAHYATNAARVANRAALVDVLQDRLRTRSRSEWLERLEAVGVPAGPINTVEQAFDDPQVRHRGMRVALDHPTLGEVPGVRCPIRMSGAEVGSTVAPPALGADTEATLSSILGIGEAALSDLRERRLI